MRKPKIDVYRKTIVILNGYEIDAVAEAIDVYRKTFDVVSKIDVTQAISFIEHNLGATVQLELDKPEEGAITITIIPPE